MHRSVPVQGLAMRIPDLTLQVLNKRAAERNVQQLGAATDGQNGQMTCHCRLNERELARVTRSIDVCCLRLSSYAVAGRIDIPPPVSNSPSRPRTTAPMSGAATEEQGAGIPPALTTDANVVVRHRVEARFPCSRSQY